MCNGRVVACKPEKVIFERFVWHGIRSSNADMSSDMQVECGICLFFSAFFFFSFILTYFFSFLCFFFGGVFLFFFLAAL